MRIYPTVHDDAADFEFLSSNAQDFIEDMTGGKTCVYVSDS